MGTLSAGIATIEWVVVVRQSSECRHRIVRWCPPRRNTEPIPTGAIQQSHGGRYGSAIGTTPILPRGNIVGIDPWLFEAHIRYCVRTIVTYFSSTSVSEYQPVLYWPELWYHIHWLGLSKCQRQCPRRYDGYNSIVHRITTTRWDIVESHRRDGYRILVEWYPTTDGQPHSTVRIQWLYCTTSDNNQHTAVLVSSTSTIMASPAPPPERKSEKSIEND